MAINEKDIQIYLGSDEKPFDFRSDSGHVGRAWVDGVLVIYDLMDVPLWLATALDARDDDGNTELDKPRVAIA